MGLPEVADGLDGGAHGESLGIRSRIKAALRLDLAQVEQGLQSLRVFWGEL